MSIGAIDFGIIVDGAVIMAENIARRLGESGRHDARGTLAIIRGAAQDMQRPVFISVSLIMVAFLPLLTLTRIEGLLFRPMALTILFALLGGLIFALILVPVLASFLFRHGYREWENPLLALVHPHLRPDHPRIAQSRAGSLPRLSIAGLVLMLTVLVPRLGTEFLPYLDEGVLWVRANFPEGTSLEQTSEYGRRLREIALEFPDIKFAIVQAGRNDDGTDPFPPSRIEMMIGPRPRELWKQFRTKQELIAALGARYRENSRRPASTSRSRSSTGHGGHQRHLGEPGGRIQRPRFQGAARPGPANGRTAESHSRRHRREHRARRAATATADPTRPGAVLRATTSASKT